MEVKKNKISFIFFILTCQADFLRCISVCVLLAMKFLSKEGFDWMYHSGLINLFVDKKLEIKS